jgi:hypothetical protein
VIQHKLPNDFAIFRSSILAPAFPQIVTATISRQHRTVTVTQQAAARLVPFER